MPIRVNLLTEGFVTFNGHAFLFPLIHWQEDLKQNAVVCNLFYEISEDIGDCDIIAVDSKFFRGNWSTDPDYVLSTLNDLASRADKLVWFDTSDSTGTVQYAVLPFVDRYLKNQVLRDRNLYTTPHYGSRIYTDFYHTKYSIEDNVDEKLLSVAETGQANLSSKDLEKMKISWNLGLSDYSRWGRVRKELYRRTKFTPLLRFPRRWAQPSGSRRVKVSSRFHSNHSRNTIRHHRQMLKDVIALNADMKQLSRGEYFKETEDTQVVIAPFSFGEITARDFEAIIGGALLVKPDMEHLETWPNVYIKNETYVPYMWNYEDLERLLAKITDNYKEFVDIAENCQTIYKSHTSGENAGSIFAERFLDLMTFN